MSAHRLVPVVALAAILLVPVLSSAYVSQEGPVARIDQALELGQITFDESVLYKAYFLYAPDTLPEEFRPREGEITKCGTPLSLEIDKALEQVGPETRDEVDELRARPVLPYYVDTEHFRIWYDTVGVNRIYGWPDTTHLNTCKVAAERCWRGEVDTLGFRPPPPDGSDPDGGGGSDHYDMYIMNLSTGLYGYCQGSYYVGGYPPGAATSFIVIDNDFSWSSYPGPTDPARITVAHEFGHGVQNAHDAGEKTWYKEATSMWLEEMMYDYINDYTSFVGMVLGSPYVELDYNTAGQQRWYGMIIWNLYMSENYGTQIVPDIWWEAEMNSELGAMNVLLGTFGTNLEDAVEDYCIWNWFTGTRDDGNHYEEGSTWTLCGIQRTYASYPVIDGGPPDYSRPDHLACNYIQFLRAGATGDALKLTYDGPSIVSLPSAAHVNYMDNGYSTFYYGQISLNPFGKGNIEVQPFEQMHTVTLVAVNKTHTVDDMNYRIDAEIVTTDVPAQAKLALAPAAPNPFAVSTEIAFSVPTGAGMVELKIYDAAGRLVRTLVDEEMPAGDAAIHWDGTDLRGEQVASGIYFARIEAAGEAAESKIALLR